MISKEILEDTKSGFVCRTIHIEARPEKTGQRLNADIRYTAVVGCNEISKWCVGIFHQIRNTYSLFDW